MTDEFTSVLVRMPGTLKAALQREAFAYRRSVTAEIVLRLEASLRQAHTKGLGAKAAAPVEAQEPSAAYRLSPMEESMLEVFNRLPPEKQLALLSLFK